MNTTQTSLEINFSAVSDRGLNERRPLNEDSYLAEPESHIFVVADGVGGAEAGEVASQTAVEVLGEAFKHHREGDDIEDLMEIAIQRANESIYRMAREHPQFASMATTVVALHLNGNRATIGHVGDSRLYLLTPDEKLYRETNDHSIVEDEVRAGRLTPEEALTHPGRNIINRALGAEATVEVDLKTIEVENGTTFLLCSDGVTRHITDDEIEHILAARNLDAACATMKQTCYERGAEDNLTAVIVRLGQSLATESFIDTARDLDEEPTIAHARPPLVPASAKFGVPPHEGAHMTERASESVAAESAPTNTPTDDETSADGTLAATHSKSRVTYYADENSFLNADAKPPRRGLLNNLLMGLLAVLIVGSFGALAFYLGTTNPNLLKQYLNKGGAQTATPTATNATTPALETPEAVYDRRRREIDRAPIQSARQMEQESNGRPLDSNDPSFLYLYGRALLLSGKTPEARQAFDKALVLLEQRQTSGRDSLKIESRLATAAAALKSNDTAAMQTAAQSLDDVIEKENAGK